MPQRSPLVRTLKSMEAILHCDWTVSVNGALCNILCGSIVDIGVNGVCVLCVNWYLTK